ncbi:MAG: hypothetical protein IPH62_07260 [Ignavibacteriae bacterium]|nr:hypothetical protein [Ignavibacteriota bacterium]
MKEELLNKIIDVAYGNASLFDKIKIYLMSLKNSEIKNLLHEYKNTASSIKKLDLEDCPDHIIGKVSKSIHSENIKSSSMLSDIYTILFGRPLLSGTLATVFILAIISTFIFKRPEIKQHYTKQQIEIAEKQTRETFELIASVLNKTKNTVEQEVLAKRVSKPIKQSLNLVNDYLEGENTNENIN